MIIEAIYFIGGTIIGYCVAKLFEDDKKDVRVEKAEHKSEFKTEFRYAGKCERCGSSKGEIYTVFSCYSVLCNRCQDRLSGLD